MARIIQTESMDINQLSKDHNHWVYNGLDAAVTLEIFNNLHPITDEIARETYEFSKALQGPVLEMVLRGVKVNQNRRKRVLGEMRQKLAQLEAQLARLVSEGVGWQGDFNWRSPMQCNKLFYDVMGLPVQKKRKSDGTYGPSTDRDCLEKLSQYFISESLIAHLLALRDLGKSIGFLETGIDPDGRMRSELKIAGTVTGRLASSASEYGTGTNMQNISESLRSVFVADPGMKLANLDLEQGDSRNIGALCWEVLVDNPAWNEATAGAYLDACESGDLHTTVAKMSSPRLPWGTKPDREIADTPFYRHKTYRDVCKALGHGSNYLGQPPTMAKNTKLPIADVKKFQVDYFHGFPCIPALHEWVFYQLEHFKQITTPFGRRRFFFGRPNEGATRREAVAYVGQSMTSDFINKGILNLWRAGKPIQLLMQVHDSILFQYPEELEDEILPWALDALRVYLTLKRGRRYSIPTEAKVGWNWGNFNPDDPSHNPDGLAKWKGSDSRKRTEVDLRLSFTSAL